MLTGCGLAPCLRYAWLCCSLFSMTRGVYCSHPWIQTTENPNAGHSPANTSQFQKGAYLRKSLAHLRHCLPQTQWGPVQYLLYHPSGCEWHLNGRLHFFPSLSPARDVCIPRHTTFEIHFQVNTLWLATNLQPTAVVTAVVDNSQAKLLPRSGMFTVTTGPAQQTLLHYFPQESESSY